ncbi:YccF domain-containing protein [Acidimicrobiia bacterium EGI L10123]|uniref:YccF domain-containing protein n=1 Tax=Salinilacustrithrix flava TaxID=2957203 RepID=UPI003D7C2EC6|nr:YccF domain-containing protein [Acidimicrobiia bacterium EGI L10123]
MRTIGNILWLILAGVWLAIGYAIAGLVLLVTIVGIPFGLQSFKLAGYSLWPFGRVVVRDPDASGALGLIGNVLWFVLAGWWLALAHVATGIALIITIIGIPLGVANFKLALLALVPFGKTVVPLDDIGGRDIYMRGPEPVR